MPIGSTNGREVEILNIEDDHSRLRVGSIARYGRPERLLTDIQAG